MPFHGRVVMARDYYAEAGSIVDDADALGIEGLGDPLRAVIAEGFSASEILMGIRWTLSEGLSALSKAPELRSRAQDLIRAISEALGDG